MGMEGTVLCVVLPIALYRVCESPISGNRLVWSRLFADMKVPVTFVAKPVITDPAEFTSVLLKIKGQVLAIFNRFLLIRCSK